MVPVDVVGAEMWCAADEVDLDLSAFAACCVVGFEAVVAVGGPASCAVVAD